MLLDAEAPRSGEAHPWILPTRKSPTQGQKKTKSFFQKKPSWDLFVANWNLLPQICPMSSRLFGCYPFFSCLVCACVFFPSLWGREALQIAGLLCAANFLPPKRFQGEFSAVQTEFCAFKQHFCRSALLCVWVFHLNNGRWKRCKSAGVFFVRDSWTSRRFFCDYSPQSFPEDFLAGPEAAALLGHLGFRRRCWVATISADLFFGCRKRQTGPILKCQHKLLRGSQLVFLGGPQKNARSTNTEHHWAAISVHLFFSLISFCLSFVFFCGFLHFLSFWGRGVDFLGPPSVLWISENRP